MKLLKRVDSLEVKRCFVVSQYGRGRKDKRDIPTFTKRAFARRLSRAKNWAKKLSQKQLDRIIASDWKRRLRAYDSASWWLGQVNINEVGVWRRAGGLPLSWTNCSLQETAKKVAKALPAGGRSSALKTIPKILKTSIGFVQKEKLLFPIVFQGGTGTRGRKGLKKMRGDIDNGCMRAIALAMTGKKSFKAYIGVKLQPHN